MLWLSGGEDEARGNAILAMLDGMLVGEVSIIHPSADIFVCATAQLAGATSWLAAGIWFGSIDAAYTVAPMHTCLPLGAESYSRRCC
jgi:hypothetical protein